MRIVGAVLLLAVAAALGIAAAGAFRNVWASHPDGPRWGYLVFGLVATAIALLPLWTAWRLLRPERSRR
jgi:hypothetical protein